MTNTVKKLRRVRTTRKGWVRKLDAICREIVLLRDGSCAICGTKNQPTPGHVFSRVAYSTRWDLTNIYQQCLSHNFRHEIDPYPFLSYAEKVLGKNGLEKLHLKYNTPKKLRDWELEAMYEELKLVRDAYSKLKNK